MIYKEINKHSLCGNSDQKPIEIYMFVDPLCPECWALEPILKKLQIEYGQYFRIRYVLSGQLTRMNAKSKQQHALANQFESTASRSGMSCDGSVWFDHPISAPYLASIALKAAELQGHRRGLRFLRKLQEQLFLKKSNVSDLQVLVECAKSAKLDVVEFMNDIYSNSASKAFQCDLKISSEMEVEEIPTLVFFNENIEDEGVKITGVYDYDVYVQILEEMLDVHPEPSDLPSMDDFLNYYELVATKEVAVVYGLTDVEAEKEMKKRMLQQKVEEVPAKYGSFWKYKN